MNTPEDQEYREECLEKALTHLRKARDWAACAQAPRTTDAIRRAIKSLEGAQRHLANAPARQRRQAQTQCLATPCCAKHGDMSPEPQSDGGTLWFCDHCTVSTTTEAHGVQP